MIKYIPISKIRVITRKPFERADDDLETLIESIREFGVLAPIDVRKARKCYIVILGRRRVLAARALGLKKIPACVVDDCDAETAQVIWECSSWSGKTPKLRKTGTSLFPGGRP